MRHNGRDKGLTDRIKTRYKQTWKIAASAGYNLYIRASICTGPDSISNKYNALLK